MDEYDSFFRKYLRTRYNVERDISIEVSLLKNPAINFSNGFYNNGDDWFEVCPWYH